MRGLQIAEADLNASGNLPFRVKIEARDGWLSLTLPACSGEIWLPEGTAGERRTVDLSAFAPPAPKAEPIAQARELPPVDKPFKEMSVEELQGAILAKMAKNGPVTEEMRRTVLENTHPGSLLNWVRSFR